MAVRLPRSFKPTHATAGLDGFPAIDVFGSPGEAVVAGFAGTVTRVSGKDPAAGGKPGGAYGRSLYIEAENGDVRYVTHFGELRVRKGDRVRGGTVLGTICDSAVSGKPGTSHVHYGKHSATRPLEAPPAPLYDVTGPEGGNIARRKSMAAIAAAAPRWVKRFGSVTVRAAR